MNIRVPWNAGNFLTTCKPVSCSRTLHRGVSKYVIILTLSYLVVLALIKCLAFLTVWTLPTLPQKQVCQFLAFQNRITQEWRQKHRKISPLKSLQSLISGWQKLTEIDEVMSGGNAQICIFTNAILLNQIQLSWGWKQHIIAKRWNKLIPNDVETHEATIWSFKCALEIIALGVIRFGNSITDYSYQYVVLKHVQEMAWNHHWLYCCSVFHGHSCYVSRSQFKFRFRLSSCCVVAFKQ